MHPSALAKPLARSPPAGQRGRMSDDLPADRRLAISLVDPSLRPALTALLTLDQRLAGIVRTTREPLVGQMRLTWWHEALGRLDVAPAPAEPLLQAIQRTCLPLGLTGGDIAALTDGWEMLLDPLEEAGIATYAAGRGGRLFTLLGRATGGDAAALAVAGEGWALADLSTHVSQVAVAEQARFVAHEAFARAFAEPWPKSLRPIGVLALLQMLELEGKSPIRNYARLTAFRWTGR